MTQVLLNATPTLLCTFLYSVGLVLDSRPYPLRMLRFRPVPFILPPLGSIILSQLDGMFLILSLPLVVTS